MKHKNNNMGLRSMKLEEVWYVDSGASNHMMNHVEWLSSLEKVEQPGVVMVGDNTVHSIKHVGDVPCRHGQKGMMWNVLHVLTIEKNKLFSIRLIVDQGIQVQFNHHGYFIDDEGWLMA